jgi:hypothetical protein
VNVLTWRYKMKLKYINDDEPTMCLLLVLELGRFYIIVFLSFLFVICDKHVQESFNLLNCI